MLKIFRLIVSLFLSVELLLCGLFAGGSPLYAMPRNEAGEYGKYVNAFIGTGGIPWVCGMLSPAAQTPFGCVRPGPDTSAVFGIAKIKTNTSGYYYEHRHVLGFSLGRLSGTGAKDYGMFRVTPAAGHVSAFPPPALAYSHNNETASPGYYAAYLPGAGCLAEFTAAAHTAVERYTFDTGRTASLYINAASVLTGGHTENARVDAVEGNSLTAETTLFGDFTGRYGGLKVYLYAEWDIPAQSVTYAENGEGVLLSFGKIRSRPVTLKMGVSFVSKENARKNLLAEVGGAPFEAVLAAARAAWEKRLGAVKIEADEQTKTLFYTALYRCMLMPTDFTDVTGEYLGFDGRKHTARGFTYRTDLSLWDTARTTHPLYTLLAPEVQTDALNSLLCMAKQGGTLPRWPQGAGESGSMFGNPANLLFAESFSKGFACDYEAAYTYMKRAAETEAGRDDASLYNEYGYLPEDLSGKYSVSRTLEYAWADAATAALGAALGKKDAAVYARRAQNYKNLWDAETRYFRPRNADGGWCALKPNMTSFYDEVFGFSYSRAYCEGSPQQWRWSVQQDPAGLIALFGGSETFVKELEAFMRGASRSRAAIDPGAGYWVGNQHDIHTPYLFAEAGRADLTQKWVRWTLSNRFSTEIDGLDGNDDGGTLCAWYVFSALGFYPVAGTDRYWVGSPAVESAVLTLPGGAKLTVKAGNQNPANVYVRSVSLNGRPVQGVYLTHAQLLKGGTLAFEMSDTP